MQNTKHLTLIIFIATSFHAIFGMNDAEFSLRTPFFAVNEKSPAKAYVSYGNQMYQLVSSKGSVSLPQKNVPFAGEKENKCTIVRSTNSYGIFNQESNNLVLENFELTPVQLEKIESSCRTNLVVIWHAGQRYDIRAAQKIDQNFKDQFLACREQLLAAKNNTANAMKIVDEYIETLKTSVANNKKSEQLIEKLTSDVKNYNDAGKVLTERYKVLDTEFNTHKKRSDEQSEHYKKIARDNTFLKTILGLALLAALCNYYDLASKVMSSFATSVQ